jgi:hypothetical protein
VEDKYMGFMGGDSTPLSAELIRYLNCLKKINIFKNSAIVYVRD